VRDDQTILNVLKALDAPASLGDILLRLPSVPKRTLQRDLRRLADAGQIIRVGVGRRQRYVLPQIGTNQNEKLASTGERATGTAARIGATDPAWKVARPAHQPVQGTVGTSPEERPLFEGISLAPDATELLKLVSRPISERTPVGYQREWLQSYVPGETSYLSSEDRRRLGQMGATDAAGMPPGTYGRAVMERLLIDLSWASSHLEGNTYTRLDTRELITRGQVASGHDAVEAQMILNHKRAIEAMLGEVEPLELSVFAVRGIHGALSENLMADPADEGRVRQRTVLISGSVYRPMDVPDVLTDCLEEIVAIANRIPDAFERSFFLLVHLPYLQPFADVNKRTSRLVANIPLIAQNLCPLTFVDVPVREYSLAVLGVYELARVELLRDLYLWAYERSTREYIAVQRSVVQPNPLRLRYREAIHELIQAVVRNPELDPLTSIAEGIKTLVPPEDAEAVHALVIADLRGLHEGTISRYGLRLSEFKAWRESERGISH
jgi:DNA-binding transcriptional ArsR family regulator